MLIAVILSFPFLHDMLSVIMLNVILPSVTAPIYIVSIYLCQLLVMMCRFDTFCHVSSSSNGALHFINYCTDKWLFEVKNTWIFTILCHLYFFVLIFFFCFIMQTLSIISSIKNINKHILIGHFHFKHDTRIKEKLLNKFTRNHNQVRVYHAV